MVTTAAERTQPSAHRRMAAFDILRGFSVVSMVLFHLCYDIRYVYQIGAPWFEPPLQDVWRASISWVFLFVAGCMCSFSRNGLKRAMRYLAAAAAVWLATTIVAVDTPISFGIIYCMGASTLVEYLLQRMGLSPEGHIPALALFLAFLCLRGVPYGYLGLSHSLSIALPRALYATPWLSWLGLPGPAFVSGDYYPLLPYTLMFLVGTAMGRHWAKVGYPTWVQNLRFPPFEAIGRHALPIYLLHQPLLVGLFTLLV